MNDTPHVVRLDPVEGNARFTSLLAEELEWERLHMLRVPRRDVLRELAWLLDREGELPEGFRDRW